MRCTILKIVFFLRQKTYHLIADSVDAVWFQRWAQNGISHQNRKGYLSSASGRSRFEFMLKKHVFKIVKPRKINIFNCILSLRVPALSIADRLFDARKLRRFRSPRQGKQCTQSHICVTRLGSQSYDDICCHLLSPVSQNASQQSRPPRKMLKKTALGYTKSLTQRIYTSTTNVFSTRISIAVFIQSVSLSCVSFRGQVGSRVRFGGFARSFSIGRTLKQNLMGMN